MQPGARVAMLAETGADFAAAFFGAIYAGVWPVPLPLPTSFGGKEAYIDQLAVQLASSDPLLLLYPEELATMAEPAKLFAFPPRARSEEKPVVTPPAAKIELPAPVAEPEPVAETAAADELDLTEEEIVLEAPETVAAATPKIYGDDELLLDTDTILTPPVSPNPVPPGNGSAGTRSWVADAEPAQRAPRVAREGGTLFERMSNIARGAAKAQVEEDAEPARTRDPLDIPRFLNRQNNQ